METTGGESVKPTKTPAQELQQASQAKRTMWQAQKENKACTINFDSDNQESTISSDEESTGEFIEVVTYLKSKMLHPITIMTYSKKNRSHIT